MVILYARRKRKYIKLSDIVIPFFKIIYYKILIKNDTKRIKK